jgi:hypothetical protein
MSYQYERRRPPERRNRRRGCLVWLVVLVWGLLLLLLAYRYWVQPQISRYIGEQIAEQVRAQIGQQAGQQLEEGMQNALPTVVAALPSGELRITEDEANAYFAANAAQLRPIDSVRVRFLTNEVQADIGAMGTTSTARLSLAVQC